MELKQALDLLDAKFNPNNIPWRRRKNELLYTYAWMTAKGCIVELGTDQGMGAIALALGTQMGDDHVVITIDPYLPYHSSALGTGWDETNEAIFHANIAEFGLKLDFDVIQVKKTSQDAAKTWRDPIGFLLWDTTVDGANIADDLELWDKHLLLGAFFMARDKEDGHYGSLEAIKRFTESGRYVLIDKELFTTVLVKMEDK